MTVWNIFTANFVLRTKTWTYVRMIFIVWDPLVWYLQKYPSRNTCEPKAPRHGFTLKSSQSLLSRCAMERRMLNVKLKDRIRNTIIRQRTRVTDIVQCVTNTKWKWARHIAQMKDNRWTIRSTEWQIKDVRSVGRSKHRCRDDIVGQQGVVWTRIAKDRERWRTLAEGYFLQWKDTA